MIVSDDDLLNMAETIWSSVLGLKLFPGNGDETIDGDAITSCVQVTGDWEGAITVRCSTALAGRIASAMFEMAPDELSDDEINDAMGEIANMTGGNVKGLAPGTNTLALPTVARGDDTAVTITKVVQTNRVIGLSDDEPVIITVLGRGNA